MSLASWAAAQPGRCPYGYAAMQHPGACECAESEWAIFVAAVKSSVRADGTVHIGDVRPKIRGRIAPKHIGQMWRRARSEGLVRDTGEREPSTDAHGRNLDKLERIYALERAA